VTLVAVVVRLERAALVAVVARIARVTRQGSKLIDDSLMIRAVGFLRGGGVGGGLPYMKGFRAANRGPLRNS